MLVWATGIGLVLGTGLRLADVEDRILQRLDGVAMAALAPISGIDVSELVDRLAAAGFETDDSAATVSELAARYGAETDEILEAVFQ